MALPNEIHPFAIAGGGNQYQVANSLRFRASNSAYLYRTPASAGNQKTWTFSFWVKRGSIDISGYDYALLNVRPSAGSYTIFSFRHSAATGAYGILFEDSASGASLASSRKFRDTSAWYHVLLAVDTTQATSSNRVKIYINNEQITSFDTYTTYPTQNINTLVNSTNSHNIGRDQYSTSNLFDGYMAEVNFIDGQSLDPTYFGQTDSITNQWVPKKYTGSYGTNGFYLPFNTPVTSTYSGSFNGSNQYLQTTLPATLTGAFTIEFLYYRNSSGLQSLFTLGDSSTSTGLEMYIGSTGTVLQVYSVSQQISTTTTVTTSAWNHIAVTRDASNVVRMFLNGSQVGSTWTTTAAFNNVLRFGVEYYNGSIGAGYINGNVSNLRIVNGTCLYTSSYNVPAQALTAISGTSLLTLQSSTVVDNSGNALSITNNGTVTMSAATPWTNFLAGQDSSGNGNGWTSSGISITSGSTYDVMIDSPTAYNDGGNNRGNYPTLNAIDPATRTLSDGNLKATGVTTNNHAAKATMVITGKTYWECQDLGTNIPSWGNFSVGICQATLSATASWFSSGAIAVRDYDGNLYRDGVTNPSGVSAPYGAGSSNDIYMLAYDPSTTSLWIGRNGTWFNSGNPAAGTGAISTVNLGNVVPMLGVSQSGDTGCINFGQRPFTYTPPAGFKALNTYNLANPSLPLV